MSGTNNLQILTQPLFFRGGHAYGVGGKGTSHKIIFFFFFLAALGLRCFVQAFSICSKFGVLFVAVCGLLIVLASSVAEHRLEGAQAQ